MSQETDTIKSTIARLTLSAGRRMKVSNEEDKNNLVAAIAMLSVAATVCESDPGIARAIYSQARQLISLQGQADVG